jgi:hypothetical protein
MDGSKLNLFVSTLPGDGRGGLPEWVGVAGGVLAASHPGFLLIYPGPGEFFLQWKVSFLCLPLMFPSVDMSQWILTYVFYLSSMLYLTFEKNLNTRLQFYKLPPSLAV